MVGRSMFVAVVCGAAVSRAQQQPCTYTCTGYLPTYILTRAHLATAPYVLVDVAGSPPAWWDASWLTHLTNACSAFAAAGMNATVLSTGFQNIEVILVGHQEFWPESASTSDLAVTEDFLGNGYVSEKKIWINLFYWGDSAWYEESVGGPTYPQHDLTTVLVHEIGHAFGFSHMPDGLEHCSVMTTTTAPAEMSRSLKLFDVNALVCYYPSVAVGDIQSFGVQGVGHNVNASFTIQGGANPNEYAAVYVSSSPAGPARLIDLLTDHANLMPAINNWVDSYRLPPAGQYYYWLDYNIFPGLDVLRSPEGLYPATTSATVSGTAFTTFDSPDISSALDVPFDLGGKVEVHWSPSTDEASIDYYNIYRNMYPPGEPEEGEWKYIASVDPPTNEFLDEYVVTNWVSQYKVSAAHHGNYTLQPGRGNEGIWNATSLPVTATAINNFWIDQIGLLSNDTLQTCPAGHADVLQAEVAMWGSNIAPTVGIPPAMIECYPIVGAGAASHFCAGDPLIMDGPTDANGRTTLTTATIGGHDKTDLVFALAESTLRFDTLTVYLKSPDENGDGTVNVSDFALFALSFASPPKPYVWYRDFDAPYGVINLQDFGYFAAHNNHACSGGQMAASQVAQSNATVQIALTEVVSATNSRFLNADISVANLSPFKAILLNLRSDNSMLEFASWEKGEFPGRVLATPVVRDGVKEIAIGVLDGAELRGSTASLGRLVFRISSNEDLALTVRDFETRAADVLSTSGTVLRMGSATSADSREVPRIVGDELAQNRPNPFNPVTTLSYSISKPGYVQLRVFGVDGSLVRTLVNRDQKADRYDVQWDGTDDAGQRVASGVYFYTLKTPLFASTKKMVLLK